MPRGLNCKRHQRFEPREHKDFWRFPRHDLLPLAGFGAPRRNAFSTPIFQLRPSASRTHSPRIPARADAGQLRIMRRRWHIGWHIRWGTTFPPPGGHNTLIPRQFACVITPDPIAFLLPNGHQRATRAGHTDTDAAGKPIGSGAPRHDELARTVHIHRQRVIS